MRVTSRYLLPAMLKTIQLPTVLACAIAALTSAQQRHATVLLLTCVYQAQNRTFGILVTGASPELLQPPLEITRIHCCSWYRHPSPA